MTTTHQNSLGLNRNRLSFIANALHGTGGFSDGTYLLKYGRESDKKYEGRKELAWYRNDLKPACSSFVGYLTKKPPKRDTSHPLVQAFLDDCNWKNDSLDVFLAGFALESKARGCGLVLVDMPVAQPNNQAEQKAQRFFPYLVTIHPETVLSYTLNATGLLDSIEIESTMLVDGALKTVIRGWDTANWWVRDGNVQLEGDAHNLGMCPVLAFSEGDLFPYVGTFAQIADLSKRLYNLRSELDEILRAQTFSLLTYQVPPEQAATFNAGQVAEAVGTHNMMIYSGNQAPSFAAPPDGPATIYMSQIAAVEKAIKDIAMTIEPGTSGESGIALTIRFQTLNSELVSFARKMEDLERRIWDVVHKWLGIENRVTTSWAKEFSISDLQAELDTLKSYEDTGFPDEVIKAKKQQIVTLDFSNMERDALQALTDAIEATNPETPVMDSRLAMLEATVAEMKALIESMGGHESNNTDSNDNQDNQDTNTEGGAQ